MGDSGTGHRDTRSILAEAILDDELVALLEAPRDAGLDPHTPAVDDAIRCVEGIAAVARQHRELVGEVLDVVADVHEVPARQQRPLVEVTTEPARVDEVRDRLESKDYEPIERLSPGAWRSMVRVRRGATFASRNGDGLQVRVDWADRSGPQVARSRFTPGPADWKCVDLPASVWPAYHAVRAVNVAARTLRLSRREPVAPHLPTPIALVRPILEFGGVTRDDLLLDAGCGDGAVLVEATRRLGVQCLGIESDATLIESARRAAQAAGVEDRVELVCASFTTADVSRATAAFVFMPPRTLPRAVRLLQERLRPGSTIVGHEQARLHDGPVPVETVPVFADAALTVAHRWVAGTPE